MEQHQDRVALTVDAVITDEYGRVLVMERGTEPFFGTWVLPGGYVDPGETVEQACIREVCEELGLEVKLIGLIGIYSEPGRDPRGSVVSIAYGAEVIGGTLTVTAEARAHRWLEPGEDVPMGFDHARILADHRAQIRA
ncbi:MAG: NUDIX hydrolase [Flavobacteriales bacterium]|jgi:8-oxo-dGTP diphosphatase|nr:NUDIX hydrolase [Flavobacteriales bacterium]MBK9700553.1 NUDIX hydrolase [Flavobacteriales bacterium]